MRLLKIIANIFGYVVLIILTLLTMLIGLILGFVLMYFLT